MKAKKHDISVRELFRQKLESAEVIPDASVNARLMHKLAIREFFHFNPARFNIYYLGGILVAGISIAIILSSGTGKSDKLPDLNIPGEHRDTVGTINITYPIKNAVVQKSGTPNKYITGSIRNKPVIKPEISAVNKPVQTRISKGTDAIITHPGTNDSFTQKGLFTGPSKKNTILQGGNKSEELIFESSFTEGCAPLKILFHNKIVDFDSCRWTFGDGGSSDKKDPGWIFDVEGEYKVVLEVFGPDGLRETSSKIITVYPKPSARFELSPDKANLPDDEISFLNYSADAVKFNWDFGDGTTSELFEPTHRYEKFGNFNVRLIVSSEYGCSDSLIVVNAFSDSKYFIDFPNAFIPSTGGPTGGFYSSKSDEAAQVFHPANSGVGEYQLKIFSKLGLLIFESNDIYTGWDGYFNGQLCNPGVYIWKVRGNFINGEPFTKLGDVILLRN
ncbi:MAG: PKD domain-containing protein [Bacteroidales bacterium]|nr:PKD domain-containing protein [Bacteroidales bacterium]